MAYQGFFLAKAPGYFHQINGFDPLQGMRVHMESSIPMMHFEQVYTSSHWMIRIFRVLSPGEDRTAFHQAQERYTNLIAQQTEKAKARQDPLKNISHSEMPHESGDSRAYVRVSQDADGNPQKRQVDAHRNTSCDAHLFFDRYYDAHHNEISSEEFSVIVKSDQVI